MEKPRPPRVKAWMLGYYASQQELRKGLIDIPLEELDGRYLDELTKRAYKETKFLVEKRRQNTFKRRNLTK